MRKVYGNFENFTRRKIERFLQLWLHETKIYYFVYFIYVVFLCRYLLTLQNNKQTELNQSRHPQSRRVQQVNNLRHDQLMYKPSRKKCNTVYMCVMVSCRPLLNLILLFLVIDIICNMLIVCTVLLVNIENFNCIILIYR